MAIVLAITMLPIASFANIAVSVMANSTNSVKVHFYNEKGWANPNIYYYQDGNVTMNWPGVGMNQEEDRWYSYEIPNYSSAKVLFNNGRSEQIPDKTSEGYFVEGEKWYKKGKWYDHRPLDVVVHFYTKDWQQPYIYYYESDTNTGKAWPGEIMQSEGNGWFTYTITEFEEPKVLFNNGNGMQIPAKNEPGFPVNGEAWYKDGKWYEQNPDVSQYKIAPEQSEYNIEIGEEQEIYFCIVDTNEETQCNFSYQVEDKDQVIKKSSGQTSEFGVGEIIVSSDKEIDTEIIIEINNNIQQKIKLKFSKKQPSITDKPSISYQYGTDCIIISWKAIKNAEEYEIYKSCNQEDYEKISTTENLEFIDGELQSGFIYDYYVKAICETEESEKSNKVHLEYTQNIDNLGELSASATSIFENIEENVVFQVAPIVKLPNNLTIKVEQLDEDNQEKGTLVELKDDGMVSQGDDIANDGIYSGKVKIDASEQKEIKCQAVVTLEIEGENKRVYSSNQLKIGIINKIPTEEVNKILDLTKELQNQCNSLENIIEDKEKAEHIVALLENKSEIKNVSISDQSNTVYCLLQSGIKMAVPIAEAGTNSFDLQDSSTEVVENYQKHFQTLKNTEIHAYVSENGMVSLEDLKTLYQYQAILLNVSGEMYGNTPYLCTNTIVSKETLLQYEQDIEEGNLILISTKNGVYFGVLPQYIEKYNKEFAESIIFLSASKSMANEKFCHVFEKLGVGHILGFRDSVLSEDAEHIVDLLIESLVKDELTTTQAYNWVVEQLKDANGEKSLGTSSLASNFTSYEVSEIQLDTAKNLRNGSFENDFDGWSTKGDARTINQLGELVPVDGDKMAIISTGLGAVEDSDSSLVQKIYIEEGNSKINISYNFISEEPMEYVGRNYDDKFQCRVNGNILIEESINESVWIPANGIDFYGGDHTAFMTGWITREYDLSEYIGETITLEFRVWDVGDSAYDSAALIDYIHLQSEETIQNDKESIMWPTDSKKVMSYFEEKDMVTEKNMGINIMTEPEESVMVSHDGTVTNISSNGYGDYIEIENEWDTFSIITRYANVQSVRVAVGDEVEVGKEIAKVANTESIGGNILHFEIIEKRDNTEKQVDPYAYIMPISNKNVEELEYLSQPYFTTVSTVSAKSGIFSPIAEEIRYIKNLDLANGQVYLENLYPILKEKGDSMKKKSANVFKVKLNGRTKTYGTAKKYNNAKLVNGHLVVNLKKFMKYFYKDYSEIFGGNYNRKFIIGENKYYPEIEKLQTKLKNLGYCAKNGDKLNRNGYFDMNTAYAVTLYSSAHGLNIAGIDNKTPGMGININSVIWFTLFSGRAKQYSNVIKESTFVPKTKNLLNQYCYVFYLPEWEKEATDNKKTIEDYFNLPNKNVIIKPFNKNSELVKAWNEMDMIKKQKVYIKAVVLNTHATNAWLSYISNTVDKFDSTQISQLNKTYIEYLILLGCNAAHQDYPNNIACQFAKKNGYKMAVGSDGTVQYHKKYIILGDWIYNPNEGKGFIKQTNDAGAYRTKCNGFLKISYNSKGKKKERIIGKKLTLKKLLEKY